MSAAKDLVQGSPERFWHLFIAQLSQNQLDILSYMPLYARNDRLLLVTIIHAACFLQEYKTEKMVMWLVGMS